MKDSKRTCNFCGCDMSDIKSIRVTILVCSQECDSARKKLLPKRISVNSTQYWLNKGFTLEEAKNKISENQRARSPRCVEYWIIRGFSSIDAIGKVTEHQKKNADIKIQKYKGRKDIAPSQVGFWMARGLNKEESEEKIKSIANNCSLSFYENKYGEDIGKIKYEERLAHIRQCRTLEHFVTKYGEVIGKERWTRWQRASTKYSQSKISIEFFDRLSCLLDKSNIELDIRSYKNSEWYIVNGNKDIYYYDFTFPEISLILEFNGDFWHAKPGKYKPNDTFNRWNGLTAEEIWKKDERKNLVARNRNFEIITIWESDYKSNKEEVVANIFRIINEKVNSNKKSF